MLWNKLDTSLGSRYGAYLRDGVDARLLLSLAYEGELGPIEAAGFETVYTGGPKGYATGRIRLSQLEAIASAPGVVRMSLGRPLVPRLDVSVPQIRARPEVWDWDAAASQFVPTTGGKGTGKGVLIGVIDTGIDWQHAYFLKETEPLKVTRIRAIWDQGLRPDPDEVDAGPPHPGLLTGEADTSYGIEYDFARIQAALLGGPGIRHRDCHGHGTHVASIAAGNGGDARTFIGVAPEAELIVVKAMFLQQEPVDSTGAEIGFDVRLHDAVHYILAKATLLGKPVVINASLGNSSGPHDGFTSAEDWLTDRFDGKTGICFVAAAGNEAGDNAHAQIEFTGGPGEVDIDLELLDRLENRKDYNYCEERSAVPKNLTAELYYPAGAGPLTVSLKVPGETVFHAGPARGAASSITVSFEDFEAHMWHVVEDQPRLATGAGLLQRSKFILQLPVKTDEGEANPRYREGPYTLRLENTSPDGFTAHLWCEAGGWVELKLDPPFPPSVTMSDEFLIGAYGGSANVVTVAAYNAESGTMGVAGFSSRGPLVNYESADPHPVPKPDIAAPGVAIDAAGSREIHQKKKRRKRAAQGTQKRGTSMACPHVAGVVALMLENKPDLTSTQIRDILRDRGRTPREPLETEIELGQGRVDAKLAFDAALTP